jgi:hypothetical protein
MSTPGKKNIAFRGDHVTPEGGRAFRVYYLGQVDIREVRKALRECGQRVYPPGHKHAIRAGWYWITLKDVALENAKARVGPFTSSRGAYLAAIQRLDGGKG